MDRAKLLADTEAAMAEAQLADATVPHGTYAALAEIALRVIEGAYEPTEAAREELDKRIHWAVLEECEGYLGGEPHATTWSRGGYRNDIPTLCDRCGRLIRRLQSIVATERLAGESKSTP